MTIDTSEPYPTAAPPAGFARGADPVEAAIARHQGTRQDLQHAADAMKAADRASRQVEAEADAAFSAASEADGAAWADLLATRPGDLPGAVRLLRYVSASPASEVVEDPQDLLRQLAVVVEAAETDQGRAEPIASTAEPSRPDPVFATIEAHRAAFTEWDRLSDARDALAPGAPGYAEAAAATDEPFEREVATFEALFSARPTTLPGAKAQAEYLVEAIRRARTAAEPPDGERGLRTVSEALDRLLGPGATDGAGRDWRAWAAMHPGFVPFPAHAPSALVALDLAIRGEAERMLALAEAEIGRRRQDFVNRSGPDVWPRVERSLRREMRMLEPHGAPDDWWHDAIREILASAHQHYVRHLAHLYPANAGFPGEEDLSARSAGRETC